MVSVLLSALLLAACLPVQTPDTTATLHKDNIESWYKSAESFFLNPANNQSMVEFAEQLQALVAPPDAALSNDSVRQASQNMPYTFTNDSITLLNSAKALNLLPAKIDLLEKKTHLFWAHQFGFYGDVFLSDRDQQHIENNSEYKDYLKSLSKLTQMYPAFHKGRTEIYAADNETKLLAFSRIYKNTRVFIAVNLSFETHEIPLPFGFMSSTKVLMWESDNIQLREFVTQSAITISPYTSAIIIVGG
jgi:hypothetical protein